MQQTETREQIRGGIQRLANRSCSAGVGLVGDWVADDGSHRNCGGPFQIVLRPYNGAWNIEHYQVGSYFYQGTVVPSGNTGRYQFRLYRNSTLTDGKDYPVVWDERWDVSLTKATIGKYSASAQYTRIESGYWERNDQYTCTAVFSQTTEI
jgi:hypothetical protein